MIYKNKRKKGITSMKMNLKNKITFNICVIVTSVSYTLLARYKILLSLSLRLTQGERENE